MKYTKIYVGSNNETGELETEKIKEVMGTGYIVGYTLILTEGYYKGILEKSCIIEIMGDYNTGIIPELKAKLKQDSMMVVGQISEVSFL